MGTYQRGNETIEISAFFDHGTGIMINEKKTDNDENTVYPQLIYGSCSYRDGDLVVEVIRNQANDSQVEDGKELIFQKISD